jgi:hypothetical protein
MRLNAFTDPCVIVSSMHDTSKQGETDTISIDIATSLFIAMYYSWLSLPDLEGMRFFRKLRAGITKPAFSVSANQATVVFSQ